MAIVSINEVDLQTLHKTARDLQWVIADLAGGKRQQPDSIARLQEALDAFGRAAAAVDTPKGKSKAVA